MARGRKINSNGERSKQLLLEKAMDLFSMKGYYETKISDIVKAANVTQPTFYLYFESKDSLYNNLNEKFLYEFNQIMNKSSEQVEKGFTGFIRALEQKITLIFIYIIENPTLTKIGFLESTQSHSVKSQLSEHFLHLINLHDCLHILQSYRVDSLIMVDSFVGSLDRLIVTHLFEQKKQPADLAKDVIHLYFLRDYSGNT